MKLNPIKNAQHYTSELALAALVIGIVAMMILPLPTWLLDILISLNIAIAVTILLTSIYITSALRIASFPATLLITTLFRLGLNVSSTRLILLQADAGEVIHSFGRFVVAGNVIVGGVIFLILTIIQFIVIAKGGERVAEVAARFTLDAMPGRQMAIDADLRAGAIEMEQAKTLRNALQRESQFYGSMDGAMKFVKGDAIAGIIIAIINIVGGLLIGMLQRGMSAGDAVSTYAVLTIGDGLVSQIPALLTSMAAGIVVTRVASEDQTAHLGRDMGRQFFSQPRILAMGSSLFALLAIVPGMPTVPFLMMAFIGAATAWINYRKTKSPQRPSRRAHFGSKGQLPIPSGDGAFDAEPEPPSLITLALGDHWSNTLKPSNDGGKLMQELIPGLRETFFAEIGLLLPGVFVRGAAHGADPMDYQILLTDVPMATGHIPKQTLFAIATMEQLEMAGIPTTDVMSQQSIAGLPFAGVRVSESQLTQLQNQHISFVDAPTEMVLHLGQVLRNYCSELLGLQETQQLLSLLERTHPVLVNEVVPKMVSLHLLNDVLKRLLEEHISIRPLRDILQTLAEWVPHEKDPVVLAEHVRGGLKRIISHQYAGSNHVLHTIGLDPLIEQTIRESIQHTAKSSYLAIEPQLGLDIISSIRRAVDSAQLHTSPMVVIAPVDIRRYVRKLIDQELPDIPVVSYNDLLPTVKIQPVATASVS